MKRPAAYRLILIVVSAAIPALLATAGALKLLNWTAFYESVESFTLVPYQLRWLTATSLPSVEIFPLFLWLSGRWASSNLICSILLGGFTLVAGWHWLNNEAPDCGCLGDWVEYHRVSDAVRAVAPRNIGLFLLAAIGVIASRWLSKAPRESLA
ncbi:MAG: MauE/DoxX family redox-associated membrane protein [Planctomycetota bacterium]